MNKGRLRAALPALVGVVALTVLFASHAGRDRTFKNYVDPPMYLQTATEMHSGTGYYRAMDTSLRENVGKPASSWWAFRLPTIFLLWRLLPSGYAVWIAYTILAAITGMLAFALSRRSVVGVLVTAFMLISGWNVFTMVELWAVPFVIGTFLALRYRRFVLAAGLALTAALIREVAVLVLIAGLIDSWPRRQRAPWIAAMAVFGAVMVAHIVAVHPYLRANGGQSPLIFTGSPSDMIRMTGAGLHWVAWAGPLIWLLAFRNATRAERVYLFFPLMGLLVARVYWGEFMLVPVELALVAAKGPLAAPRDPEPGHRQGSPRDGVEAAPPAPTAQAAGKLNSGRLE